MLDDHGAGGGITADGWKEIHTQTDYFGLSIHYFVDWKLTIRVLLMTEFDTGKTGEAIRQFVGKQLLRFGITEQMCTRAFFVSDGASNMVRAFKSFEKSETTEK